MAEQEYRHGSQEILEQQKTWKGFMTWAKWGTLVIAIVVLLLMAVLP